MTFMASLKTTGVTAVEQAFINSLATMMTSMDQTVRTTKRKCRWCGKTYRAPVWERWAGCKECAPTIEDAVKEVEREEKFKPEDMTPVLVTEPPGVALTGSTTLRYPDTETYKDLEIHVTLTGRVTTQEMADRFARDYGTWADKKFDPWELFL